MRRALISPERPFLFVYNRRAKLLYLAALTLKRYVPRSSGRYYLRKLAEGKPSRLALNNISNKLLRIICAVLRDRQPYYETHRSVNPNLLQTG